MTCSHPAPVILLCAESPSALLMAAEASRETRHWPVPGTPLPTSDCVFCPIRVQDGGGGGCWFSPSAITLGLMEVLPDDCVQVGKKELMYAGTVGLVIYLGGVIFINRKSTSSAKMVMAEVAKTMATDNVSVTGAWWDGMCLGILGWHGGMWHS